MADPRLSTVNKNFMLFTTFALFMLIMAGPWFAIGMESNAVGGTGAGSSVRQALYLLVAGLIFYGLKPFENYRRVLAIPGFLLTGLGWCWLSLLWAIEPAISFRRLFLTTLIIWAVFASMRQLRFHEVLALLRIGLLIVLVLNYAAVILMPEYGLHGGNQFDELSLAGDWRGFLQHKNLAGAACAITMIVYMFDRRNLPRWFQIAVVLAAGYFLYRSNSKTSFGLGLGALVLGFVYIRYDRRYRVVLMIVIGLAAVAAVVMEALYQNPLTGNFSDPDGFTGRVGIWNGLILYAKDHPWLGAGYGSFWDIGPQSPIYNYAIGEYAKAPNGHNGFLDILVQLGIPGLLIIVAVTIVIPVKRLLESPVARGQQGALLFALFFFCISHNFTESSLFDRDLLVWFMLMIAIALSQPDLIQYQRERFNVQRIFRISRGRNGNGPTISRDTGSSSGEHE